MSYQMTVYKINGQSIYVREEGASHHPVALLIHGWSSSWYALSPLVPLLSSKRFRCLAVDLPGYGQSPPGPGRATIAGYADLLAELIKSVSNQPVVLVGHSMGGMIGLTLALRQPQLIERMVLLCPAISGRLSLFINLFVSPVTLLERSALASRVVSLLEPQMLGVTDRLMRPASIAARTGITSPTRITSASGLMRVVRGRGGCGPSASGPCVRAICEANWDKSKRPHWSSGVWKITPCPYAMPAF